MQKASQIVIKKYSYYTKVAYKVVKPRWVWSRGGGFEPLHLALRTSIVFAQIS